MIFFDFCTIYFHYLCKSEYNKMNYTGSVINPNTVISSTAGHVILRADDALYSTLSPYRDNALDWWNWLDPNHEYTAIETLRRYIASCDIAKAREYKDNVGKFFKGLGWATGRSKVLKGEIEDLQYEISTHEETIGQLQGRIQAIQNAHQRELMKLEAKHRSDLEHKDTAYMGTIERLKNRVSWQNLIIGSLSFLLLKTSDIFRKAVNGIIHLARDYYKPRFDVELVSDIKSALNLFGDDRQSHRAAGDFLYITATQKGKLDNREQIKARREVDNVVEGNYDQQQKRGFSIRR